MDRKSQAKLTIAAVFCFSILMILTLTTNNPELGTPNNELSKEECESIGFYAPECPSNNTESQSNLSDNQTNPVNESVENG